MPAVAKRDPVDIEIGERVHRYLWRNRVPQNGMAALISISGQSMGRKLRGENAWTAGELRRLAQVLGVSVGWFFGETEEEPARPKGLEPLTFWSGVWEHTPHVLVSSPRRRESPAGSGVWRAQTYTCTRCGWPSWEWLCPRCKKLVEGVRADDLALVA